MEAKELFARISGKIRWFTLFDSHRTCARLTHNNWR